MKIHCDDSQVVGETESTLFSVIQQGPLAMLIIMQNSGTNTINYRYQEYNGSAWVDLGSNGSDFYNTLIANEVKTIKVTSSYPQVRLVGNASGGAQLDFSVSRFFNRASGAALPILNL